VATNPNWIEEEFEGRSRGGLEPGNEAAREMHFQKIAQLSWERLMSEVQADIDDFNRGGGKAEFTQRSALVFLVRRAPLTLTVVADLAGHKIHYGFHSDSERVTAQEGGIFSLRPSRSAAWTCFLPMNG
jgi:hypothetical protein